MQVITRAAAILGALAEPDGGRSLAQLAAQTGLPKTTVHRICAALEQVGYVHTDATSGRRELGAIPASSGGGGPPRPDLPARAVAGAPLDGPQRDRGPGGAGRRPGALRGPAPRAAAGAHGHRPRGGALPCLHAGQRQGPAGAAAARGDPAPAAARASSPRSAGARARARRSCASSRRSAPTASRTSARRCATASAPWPWRSRTSTAARPRSRCRCRRRASRRPRSAVAAELTLLRDQTEARLNGT